VAVAILGRFHGRLALVTHYQGLYALGVALCTYGLAHLFGGNGFIAVYLAGIVMASRQGKEVAAYSRFSRELGEVFKLATFVIFGSLLVFDQLFEDGPAALAFMLFVLFAARTAALIPALIGTRLDWPQRWFMAWFGPKGVACIAYSLLVLSRGVPGADRIFHLTALVVVGSIILHGASDTPLADWFGRREEARKAAAARD
jgi:NhaP-type Na+/H+ or K+/H+ antiporter